MAQTENVRLRLLGTSANVVLVRTLLEDVAQALGLSALEADALYTAVEEACKNVVHHAYDGVEGPLELELYAQGEHTEVAVRDHGIGIRPRLGERTQPHVGIGLPMVHALTRRVIYTNLDEGGTEVRMLFATPNALALDPVSHAPGGAPNVAARAPCEAPSAGHPPADPRHHAAGAERVEMALAPRALAGHVLPGLVAALIERAGFDTAGSAGLRALGRALTERACDALAGEQLWLKASVGARDLDVRVCPLRAGRGEGVLDALRGALSSSLELSGVLAVNVSPVGEALALSLRETGARAGSAQAGPPGEA